MDPTPAPLPPRRPRGWIPRETVIAIREAVASGEPQKAVAHRFQVSRSAVCRIVSQKRHAKREQRPDAV